MKKTIAVLEGDGIGPEIMAEAEKALEAITKAFGHEFNLIHADFGGVALEKYGEPFPKLTKNACDKADAILKGPVGGPKYDSIKELELKPEVGGVLGLRKRYRTFANLRPLLLLQPLWFLSPLKQQLVQKGVDILMVRELIGGIYFGKKKRLAKKGVMHAIDTMEYSEKQIEMIARVAFKEALKRKKIVHNIHKANVLECSRLWNETVENIWKKEFPSLTVEHMLVDNAAYQLTINPCQFDVMLMENMMGDILSDLGGGIIGSLGLMPSACIGEKKAYYEPAHGSAPDIAGKGVANPFSMIGSAALMLEKSFGMKKEADIVWNSMFKIMKNGYFTHDLYKQAKANGIVCKQVSTTEFGDLVAQTITSLHNE